MQLAQFLVDVTSEVRRRARQDEPSYSTTAIVSMWFPRAVVTGRVLPDGFNEVVARTTDGPIIIYSRNMPVGKQRLAIAHALAHLLFDGDASACRPGFLGDVGVEVRADAFARELLVPATVLRERVYCWPSNDNAENEIYLDHCDDLASIFNVPSHVIDERIREFMD